MDTGSGRRSKKDRNLEVFPVSITADLTIDRHDFAVYPFGKLIGYPVRVVADYVGQSVSDRLGKLLQWNQLGVNYSLVPVIIKHRR